jgi:hypothetical protein
MSKQMILSSDFFTAICYDRRKWDNILKVLKKENVNISQGFIFSKIDLQV